MGQNIHLQLKTRVAKGLNFGFEAVEEVLDPSSSIYNEFILLQSQYNDLMYVSSVNTLPYEQLELGLNRLRSSLLRIIDQLQEEHLEKKQVDAGMKVSALPYRRTNFFHLMQIHQQNLAHIAFWEIYDDERRSWHGHQAIFETYQSCRRNFKRNIEAHDPVSLEAVQFFFKNFFQNGDGTFEVYLKNIKQLMQYVVESPVEQAFFQNTLFAALSKYELAFLFYFSLSGLDGNIMELLRSCNFVNESLSSVLILSEHYRLFLDIS